MVLASTVARAVGGAASATGASARRGSAAGGAFTGGGWAAPGLAARGFFSACPALGASAVTFGRDSAPAASGGLRPVVWIVGPLIAGAAAFFFRGSALGSGGAAFPWGVFAGVAATGFLPAVDEDVGLGAACFGGAEACFRTVPIPVVLAMALRGGMLARALLVGAAAPPGMAPFNVALARGAGDFCTGLADARSFAGFLPEAAILISSTMIPASRRLGHACAFRRNAARQYVLGNAQPSGQVTETPCPTRLVRGNQP